MPAAPPAPGVATFKAAALAEGKDPEQAVNEARTKVQQICTDIIQRGWEPHWKILSKMLKSWGGHGKGQGPWIGHSMVARSRQGYAKGFSSKSGS